MKARALLLALALAASTADPEEGGDERLQRVQERKASLERDLARLRGQEKSLLGEVERLDIEVQLREQKLREQQLVLAQTSQELDRTATRRKGLESSVAEARPQIAGRARALYKQGQLSYLRVLLSVDRPADLLRGYRFVTALARRDAERITGLRRDLAELSATRVELEERTRAVLAQKAELEAARRALDQDRRRKTALLTSVVQTKETNAAYLQELEQAESRLRQLLQGLAPGDVSVPVSVFKGALPWPVQGGKLRGGFGLRKHPKFDTYTLHNGIEIETRPEAPVFAVHEGNVVFAERFQGYGLMVVVDHGGKHHSLYAHLAELSVEAGQRVLAGQVLGTAGSSVEGTPGLYFEMRFQGRPEDPASWLRKDER